MQGEVDVNGTVSKVQEIHHLFRDLFARENQELVQTKKEKAGWIGYGPIFLLAALKDLLDLGFIGSLPGPGWVITLCFNLLMFLLLLLIRANSKLVDSRFLLRRVVPWFLVVTGVEAFLFGVNMLPVETCSMVVLYLMDRHLSDKKIEQILNIMKVLDGEYRSAMRQARRAHQEETEQAEEESANAAQYQGEEAANDAEYDNPPVRRMV